MFIVPGIRTAVFLAVGWRRAREKNLWGEAGWGRDSAFWGGRPVFPRGRVSKGIKGRARNT